MARVSSAVQCALSDHNSDLEKRDVIQSEPEHDAWWQRVPLLFIGVWMILGTQLWFIQIDSTLIKIEASSAAVQLHLCIHPKNTS